MITSVELALAEIKKGNPIVIAAEKTYLFFAAERVSSEVLSAMNGRVYVAITAAQKELGTHALYQLEQLLETIEVFNEGQDALLIADSGGVLAKADYAEAAIDLSRMAGFQPIGILTEINNMQSNFKAVTIEDVITYRKNNEQLVKNEVQTHLPTQYGTFEIIGYSDMIEHKEYVALVKGDIHGKEDVMVRLHSECLTGDIFGSKRCDCGEQLHQSLREIEAEGEGVLIYLRQEGRGIGLFNKLKAYNLQEQGYDTVEANHMLGFEDDLRDYAVAAQILKDLDVQSVTLVTNNPAKIAGLQRYGITINGRSAIEIASNDVNQFYLKTKKEKMGHLLEQEWD